MRLLCFALLLLSASLSAQSFSGGFRAGLNFVTFDGDQEMSAAGNETYETFNRTTGFHVGATFALAFTDLVGIKADLMYSQKGGERRIEGPSYFYLYVDQDDRVGELIFGDVTAEIDVVNSYIDVPVTAYYRLGPLELEGGASVGFLVNSRASGGLTYSNTPFGADEEITFNVEGSYFSDEPAGAGILSRADTPLPRTNVLPPDVVSVYYNSDSDESVYRRFDFGLVAGLSFYLDNGLFLGARYQHGLTDVSKGDNDLRITRADDLTGRSFNADDKDYTRSYQVSVGFRF